MIQSILYRIVKFISVQSLRLISPFLWWRE